MKLWIDPKNCPPDLNDWLWAKNSEEAIKHLLQERISFISLGGNGGAAFALKCAELAKQEYAIARWGNNKITGPLEWEMRYGSSNVAKQILGLMNKANRLWKDAIKDQQARKQKKKSS